MSVVIEVSPEIERRLRQKADARGLSVNVYVADLIKAHVDSGPTLDERLEPVRRQFEESGTTEEELDEFMNGILGEVRDERRTA